MRLLNLFFCCFDNLMQDFFQKKTSIKPKAKEMESKPLEYFKPMVGTRHTDPEDGITYETTLVKTNKQGYIVAYRREICKG